MKSIELSGLEKKVFYERLGNGLDIYMIPYDDKKNYYISYATRYGSVTTEFIPEAAKHQIKVPTGIAHFLEHKMFENENRESPFVFGAKYGTGYNAMTSFDSTQYICYGTKHFHKNLEFLLSFVNEPYFTDENVEKEKGIIIEELKMYQDMPESVLENKLREITYKNHPRRIDIGGSIEDVKKITKEDLYNCYNTFYKPNNMFLLIVGFFNKTEALKTIKNTLKKYEKNNSGMIIQKKYKEPESVFKKEEEIKANIQIPKVGVALKINKDKLKFKDNFKLDLYLQMLLSTMFGISSDFRETLREKKLFNSFYTSMESADNFRVLQFVAETNEPDKFINCLKEFIKKIEVKEEDLNRIKKVWIANEVKMIDVIDNTVYNQFDDILKYGNVIEDKVDIIRSLNKKELDKIINKINLNNIAVVKMLPNK